MSRRLNSQNTNNLLILACAGAGKTRHIVEKIKEARSSQWNRKDKKILVTTFTNYNTDQIISRCISSNNGKIFEGLEVKTWSAFLLNDCIKPFSKSFEGEKNGRFFYVNGIIEKNGKNGGIKESFHNNKSGKRIDVEYADIRKYITEGGNVYTNKISQFAFNINKKINELVIKRLEKLYSHIYIDEVQDMCGYDLDLIKLLWDSSIEIISVGDLRQGVFTTHKSNKYPGMNIKDYILKKKIKNFSEDSGSLKYSHRNCQEICDYSSAVFPKYERSEKCKCGKEECLIPKDVKTGVFQINSGEVEKFLTENPDFVQLGDRILEKKIRVEFPYYNFGKSKGLEFNNVLIFLTGPMIKHLNSNKDLVESSKADLYVAITRARYSVVLVSDKKIKNIKDFYLDSNLMSFIK